MTDRYIISRPNKAQAYHTDRSCFRIERSDKEPRPATQNAIEFHDLDECADCAGENYFNGGSTSALTERGARGDD